MTNTVHIMLDLETWGTKPGCDIRSIGACVFDPLTVPGDQLVGSLNQVFYQAVENPLIGDHMHDIRTHRQVWREGLILCRDFACEGSENPDADRSYWQHEIIAFDRLFDTLQPLADCDPVRKYPLTHDPQTVAWWNDQSDEAQAAFANPVDLREGLLRFSVWLALIRPNYSYPVGQMPSDDIRLWSHGPAFDPPILAAAYDACGLPVPWHYRAPRDTRTAFDMAEIADHSGFMALFNTGTYHHALDDAISQAKAVCAAFRIVKTGQIVERNQHAQVVKDGS